MDPIERSLRKTIGEHGLETAEQRRRLYDAFAVRLAQAATLPDGGRDETRYAHWSASLEAARAAIEAELIPLPEAPPAATESARSAKIPPRSWRISESIRSAGRRRGSKP